MILYNDNRFSSASKSISLKPIEENEDFYSEITNEQTSLLESVNDSIVGYYRNLYNFSDEMSVAKEAASDFIDDIVEFLKKARDRIIGFFKKWYNTIKKYISTESKDYKTKSIERLLLDENAKSKLMGFTFETGKPVFMYADFFSMLDQGLKSVLRHTDTDSLFMDADLYDPKAKLQVFTNAENGNLKDLFNVYKGSPKSSLTITDIQAMKENLDKMASAVKVLQETVDVYILSINSKFEAMGKDKNIKIEPFVASKVTTYISTLMNFLKEAMQMSNTVCSEFNATFKAFLIKAEAYLIDDVK